MNQPAMCWFVYASTIYLSTQYSNIKITVNYYNNNYRPTTYVALNNNSATNVENQ